MLQFWKKSSQKEVHSNSPSPTKSVTHQNFTCMTLNGAGTKPNCRIAPLASFDDEGLFDVGEEQPKERSRLSKTLSEVLSDKAASNYFAQYLESRSASPYIHCWFDIKQFKAELDKQPQTLKTERSSNALSPLPSTRTDHDSLSVSTDCDSFTADSSSLDYSAITVSEGRVEGAKLDLNTICDNRSSSDINAKLDADSCKCEVSPKEDASISESGDKTYTNSTALQSIVSEALKIFKSYVSLDASESIKCSEDLRREVIESICSANRVFDQTCFDKVQKFVYDTLEDEYFPSFLGSDFYCKLQIDVLTSGDVVLEDILYNETTLFYFMEFLEQENCRTLLEFWIAATNFQQQLRDQKEFFDPIEAQNDAVVLYDKYFSLQAHCPLGFGDKIRFAVEQNICGENGVVIDCFHLPLTIVEQVLEKNYLRPFVASQLFYKYLSELINAVQTNGYTSLSNGSKYAPSECSSEKSFNTNSTFLAMEVPNRYKKDRKGTDMHIDTRQLYDPDSLWKRKKHHRLSFGRITSMGKYETDFEPEPDKKSQSKFKNVLRKFVSLDEEEKREELAWQVAEMIVKDITSVTLSEHKPC